MIDALRLADRLIAVLGYLLELGSTLIVAGKATEEAPSLVPAVLAPPNPSLPVYIPR